MKGTHYVMHVMCICMLFIYIVVYYSCSKYYSMSQYICIGIVYIHVMGHTIQYVYNCRI